MWKCCVPQHSKSRHVAPYAAQLAVLLRGSLQAETLLYYCTACWFLHLLQQSLMPLVHVPEGYGVGWKNPLHQAAFDGSIERTVAMLSGGLIDIDEDDPNYFPDTNDTIAVVKWAVLHDQPKPSRASIDIDELTPTGDFNALILAADRGHSRIVKILLDKGADTSIAGQDDFTALHASVQEGHLAVTKLLVKAGAGLEAVTRNRSTPLHLAAGEGHWETLSVLLEAGANPNRQRVDGATPLCLAVQRGCEDAVKALLRAQADPLLARSSSSGATALTAGISIPSPRIVRLLVDAGADAISVVQTPDVPTGEITPLALTTRYLRKKTIDGKRGATRKQLDKLEAIRRLLLRLEAVHAVPWLWPSDAPSMPPVAVEATNGTKKATPTPVTLMLPILRRRARKPRVLLAALFRCVLVRC